MANMDVLEHKENISECFFKGEWAYSSWYLIKKCRQL